MNNSRYRILALCILLVACSSNETAVTSFRAEIAAPNLVPNPSLENASGGLPVSWVKGRWGTNSAVFTYPVSGFDGSSAAKVELTSYTSGDAKWYHADIPVTPGKEYFFSDYSIANVPTKVTVQYRMSNASFTYKDILEVPASTDWQRNQMQ